MDASLSSGSEVVLAGEQIDLFVESLVAAPLRDDRATMEFPFFALQKRPLLTPITYQDGNVSIRISPGERGIASIWDKDVLIYLSSLINAKIERGEEVSRTVRIAAYDMLRVTRRHTGKKGYQEIYDALFRLRSTTITTDIQSGGERETRGFGWIDSFRILTRENRAGNRVMQGLEITLNDWTFRALVKDRRVLAINPAYFDLTGGLERRLYEIARKHVGRQAEWRVSLHAAGQEVRLDAAQPAAVQIRSEGAGRAGPAAGLSDVPDQRSFVANDEGAAGGRHEGGEGREANAQRGGAGRLQAAPAVGHRCGGRCVRMENAVSPALWQALRPPRYGIPAQREDRYATDRPRC